MGVLQAPSFDVIDSGETFVKLGDLALQVIESERPPLLSRTIHLNEHFDFAFSSSRRTSIDDRKGFAFKAHNLETLSFSWEWFNVDEPGHAVKIQEESEVTFRTIETAEGFDIIETRFLKDLSHRVVRVGVDSPLEPHWRVVIAAGSEITWPSLIAGKVVSNSRAN
jgi:hypothetical protein